MRRLILALLLMPSLALAQTRLLSSTTDSISAVQSGAWTNACTQSGTWNVTNVSGTVSLPTGASTSANQTTELTSLASIDTTLTNTLTASIVTQGQAQTKLIVIGGQFDDVSPTVGVENRIASPRLTSLRAFHVSPRADDVNGTALFTAAANPADTTSNPTVTSIQTFPMLYTGSKWDIARGDLTGGAWSQGAIAHAVADTGNPNKIGFRARTSHITATANNNRSDLVGDVLGFAGVTLAHNNRSDTFTTTANGTTLGDGFQSWKFFSIQVDQTGAVTSWNVVLEGSLDNVTFTTILTATSATDNGKVIFPPVGAENPVLYFRSRVTAIVLGAGTNVVVKILGVQ